MGGFWVSQDVRIWALFTLRVKREGVKGSGEIQSTLPERECHGGRWENHEPEANGVTRWEILTEEVDEEPGEETDLRPSKLDWQ